MNDLALPVTPTHITTDLAAKVGEYVQAAKAPNTRRAYRAAWRAFEAWCRAHGVQSLPATPTTVVAFVADQAGGLKTSTLELRLASISQAHALAGAPSPTKSVEVATIMKGIRRLHGVRPNKKQALMVGDVAAICVRLGDDLRGKRDRALLLLGFVAGLRRSELVHVRAEEIAFRSEGMAVTIQRGKTDQEAHGRTLGIGHGTHATTCPVTAVRRWLSASGVSTGPLFRGVDRHGHLRGGGLTSRSVARIVQQLGKQVGLDPKVLGGHSLRSGFASSAAAAGIEERDIARVTGHKSLTVLRGYVQAGTLFEGDVVRRLGL